MLPISEASQTRLGTAQSVAAMAIRWSAPSTNDQDPGYVTSTAKGNTIVMSSDKSVVLEMQQISGKWYISKSSLQ